MQESPSGKANGKRTIDEADADAEAGRSKQQKVDSPTPSAAKLPEEKPADAAEKATEATTYA